MSFAHPAGLNTSNNQDANGGTTGPLKSWAGNDYFSPIKDCAGTAIGCVKTGYGNTLLPDGSNPTYDGWAVMDVTEIVQKWANGTPNYGFCTFKASRTGHRATTRSNSARRRMGRDCSRS